MKAPGVSPWPCAQVAPWPQRSRWGWTEALELRDAQAHIPVHASCELGNLDDPKFFLQSTVPHNLIAP